MGTTALVAGVALVGVFILTTQFAGRVGKDRAQDTERELPFRAEVSVLSERRLHLQAQGVQEYAIPPSRNQAATGDSEPADSEETDRYRWRYTGLRLLTQGNGQLILVPGDYTEDPKIFVVPLGDGVRLDIDSTANRLLLGASAPQ